MEFDKVSENNFCNSLYPLTYSEMYHILLKYFLWRWKIFLNNREILTCIGKVVFAPQLGNSSYKTIEIISDIYPSVFVEFLSISVNVANGNNWPNRKSVMIYFDFINLKYAWASE